MPNWRAEAVVQGVEGCYLQLLLTRSLCRLSPRTVLREAIRGGVDLVQIREKGLETSVLVDQVRDLVELAAERKVPVLINDDVEAARLLKVEGVHLGREDMPAAQARRLLGEKAWIGVSTHCLRELEEAQKAATHVGLGACFATTTKQRARRLDREVLRSVLLEARIPVFAIGGIGVDNLDELVSLGVTRIAVSAAILSSTDPAGTAALLRSKLPARES